MNPGGGSTASRNYIGGYHNQLPILPFYGKI